MHSPKKTNKKLTDGLGSFSTLDEASGKSKKKNAPRAQLTKFQWDVLEATARIPLGETRSYKWVAQQIGKPKAVRAVGQALRKNPYPLIIPCHRVIKKDGSLGGYAGEFSRRKAQLLKLEREIVSLWNS